MSKMKNNRFSIKLATSSANNPDTDTICFCCLQRFFLKSNVKPCGHNNLLQLFSGTEIDFTENVCDTCHEYVHNIEEFQKKVKKSLTLMNILIPTRDTHLKSECKQEVGIEFNTERTICVKSESDAEVNIKKVGNNFNSQSPVILVSEEESAVKEEESDVETVSNVDERSDFDESVKRTTQVKKVKNVKKPGKSKEDVYDYGGRIKIIVLGDEEIKEERKKNAEKASYVKLPFKCNFCIVGFDYENNLKEHMDKRHAKKEDGHVCHICTSVLTSKASHKEHINRHYKRFECVQCTKRYSQLSAAVKHFNDKHEKIMETVYQCKLCDFSTQTHRSYRYHLEKHKGSQKCDQCGKNFVNRSGLKAHIFSLHLNKKVRKFVCIPCNKTYKNHSGLIAHNESYHDSLTHYCVTCDVLFRTANNYLMHLKSHKNHRSGDIEKYQCDYCGSQFIKKYQLSAHISYVHLSISKHKCHLCQNKRFRNKQCLNRHIITVHEKKTMPRNKICDYCGKGFTSSAILVAHIRRHTGSRPLSCKHCAATFAHPAALYTHNKHLHPG